MKSLSQDYLGSLTFSANELMSLTVLARHQGRQDLYSQQIPQELDALKKHAIIESTISSNRIEGIVVEKKRMTEIMNINAPPVNRSEQEVAGYRDCLQLIHDSAIEMPFNTSVILQLHQMMNRYTPSQGGKWKITDNVISETSPDGSTNIRFRPTPAHLTG